MPCKLKYSTSSITPIETYFWVPRLEVERLWQLNFLSCVCSMSIRVKKLCTSHYSTISQIISHKTNKQKNRYIAPLKALVRERLADWKKKFGAMNRQVVEMTGDFTPDIRALRRADIVITTPEKWDGVSRSWQKRGYVQKVGLVIIDEIHLLGADRGPVRGVLKCYREFFVLEHMYSNTHRYLK